MRVCHCEAFFFLRVCVCSFYEMVACSPRWSVLEVTVFFSVSASVPAKVHSLYLVCLFVFFFPCCFTSTETMRLIRDGHPRLSHSS